MSSQIQLNVESYPFVRKIWQYSDKETKAKLKLVSKSFWYEHALSKFRNNVCEGQSGLLREIYCYGPCEKTDEFENCFQPKLCTTNWGEICDVDEPRTRDGWHWANHPYFNNDNWTRPPTPIKVREWSGCYKCWEKFIVERPEYDVFPWFTEWQAKEKRKETLCRLIKIGLSIHNPSQCVQWSMRNYINE